ncbi:hypothetical protein PPL_02090 [Heterostelium album PN500]|uniref:Uncharacterized protein n=1 Tax=Heterostelium pallidum (strain ATCC 26659 / Pp 5 / PN500) TaxID=670386 RepID=D3B1B9_HETP5|nr:hypothetical protein PPL_02090 [Heterostelium album PN500]EFA85093.1 hypothetical protein PPL_02090 [Heterostelium album PN500]|eukprot:XP_020437202.1 hypothetical protein PPL_02090 [Heterostelium album PN500]
MILLLLDIVFMMMNSNRLKEIVKNLKHSVIEIEEKIEKSNQDSRANHVHLQNRNTINDINVITNIQHINLIRIQKNNELSKKIEQYQELIDELQKKLEIQDYYLDEYKSNFTRVNEQVRQIDEKFNSFKDVFNKITKQQKEQEDERTNHIKTIHSLNQLVRDLQSEKQSLLQDKESSDLRLQSHTKIINEKIEDCKRNQATIESYRDELTRLENEKKEIYKLMDENIRSNLHA